MTTVFAPFVTAAEPFYSVRLSYLTDILTAEDGTEQRVMLRIIPRREHSFLARTYQAYRTAWLDSLTYGNQNSQLAVPEWPHGTFLQQAVTAGADRVFNVVSTADTDFAVDGTAVLWTDEGHTEEVAITAKTATSITATTAFNWPVGTFVIPSHRGNYQGDSTSQRLSASVADLPVTLTLEHQSDPEVTSPTEAEILDAVPYMRVDVSHDLTRYVARLESPTYTFADYQTGSSPVGRRPFKVWLASRASVTALVGWFHSLRGRFKTFYLPTYQQDLDVLSGLGTTTLTIKRCGYSASLFPMASRKIMAAIQPNGTVTQCTVLTATDNGVAANTETLALDVTVPSGTTQLSYLLYGRLESDTLELVWRTNGFADCEMGFVECPAELAPTEEETLGGTPSAGAPLAPAGPAVAAETTAVVPAGREDVPTYSTVTARDASGIPTRTGGATVVGSVTGANTATPTVTDLQNGTYRLIYTPANQGSDSMAITYNGSAIKNSPYTSVVGPNVATNTMPFGFWSARTAADFAYGPMTGAIITVTPSSILSILALCFASGVKAFPIILRTSLKDSAGRFSLSQFQQQVDLIAAVPGINTYISNGTFHMLVVLDDVWGPLWGNVTPSRADLSAACTYSKSVWPTVKTMIRQDATGVGAIANLDYAGCQFEPIHGSNPIITAYRAEQERAATNLGIRIVFGLNVINAGDGSSGIRGTGDTNGWTMSGAEITKYGRVLAASPMCDAFLSWRFPYTSSDRFVNYYNLSSVRTAVEGMAAFCAGEVR